MLYSELFGKTIKIEPKDAESVSHKLLVQAGFIDQLSAGIYSFLPLGHRVQQKIAQIIRDEMEKIGGQEVALPVLQPKNIWTESGRWETIDPPLFVLKDRHGKELALGPTHEEVITGLVKDRIGSYRDLPLSLFQIQVKFRNELRPSGGLLRVREFMMKDLYSFHKSEEDLDEFFEIVRQAYLRIYERCGITAYAAEASGGTIGGSKTIEFQILSESGEDEIIYCPGGDFAANVDVSPVKEGKECDLGHGKLLKARSIEVGHIFALGCLYSEKLNAYFTDEKGERRPVQMGCYGIGIGRLMGAIIETSHDEGGMIWPKNISPYDAHLISLDGKQKEAQALYDKLVKSGAEVLWDDRDIGAGEKFADADLIGIPVRLVISDKTGDKVEIKYRNRTDKQLQLISVNEILSLLKKL